MKRPVQLGLVGLGTVGSGVVRMLRESRALIEARVGCPVELKIVCDRSATPKELKELGVACAFTRNPEEVVAHPDVDIFIELIGGYEPARTLVLKALHMGKHVVTANKALLARYWGDVFEHTRIYQRLVYFEAAVGGGIPLIQAINEGLAGNRISKIVGILNGTTNFILTKMSEEGLDYKTALSQAQKAGFAEADPTFDVDGIDAAHKIAVLASIASSSWVKLSSVVTEGISSIDARDIAFVKKEFGYAVKLLGITKLTDESVEIRVHPALIPESHPFAQIKNEYNAVSIEGDAVGDVMLSGKGAGRMATASAVVSDITYLARQVAAGTAGKLPYVFLNPYRRLKPVSQENMVSRFYLRFTVKDQPGVLASITHLLGEAGVSFSGVFQPEHGFHEPRGVPIMLLTHPIAEGRLAKALKKIAQKSFVRAKSVSIRIEEASR